jgi:hypothetical protein
MRKIRRMAKERMLPISPLAAIGRKRTKPLRTKKNESQ